MRVIPEYDLMRILPRDLNEFIFLRLDLGSIFNSSQVSKSWNEFLNSKELWDKIRHDDRYMAEIFSGFLWLQIKNYENLSSATTSLEILENYIHQVCDSIASEKFDSLREFVDSTIITVLDKKGNNGAELVRQKYLDVSVGHKMVDYFETAFNDYLSWILGKRNKKQSTNLSMLDTDFKKVALMLLKFKRFEHWFVTMQLARKMVSHNKNDTIQNGYKWFSVAINKEIPDHWCWLLTAKGVSAIISLIPPNYSKSLVYSNSKNLQLNFREYISNLFSHANEYALLSVFKDYPYAILSESRFLKIISLKTIVELCNKIVRPDTMVSLFIESELFDYIEVIFSDQKLLNDFLLDKQGGVNPVIATAVATYPSLTSKLDDIQLCEMANQIKNEEEVRRVNKSNPQLLSRLSSNDHFIYQRDMFIPWLTLIAEYFSVTDANKAYNYAKKYRTAATIILNSKIAHQFSIKQLKELKAIFVAAPADLVSLIKNCISEAIARKKAEQARMHAEQERKNAEQKRMHAEQERKNAEQKRIIWSSPLNNILEMAFQNEPLAIEYLKENKGWGPTVTNNELIDYISKAQSIQQLLNLLLQEKARRKALFLEMPIEAVFEMAAQENSLAMEYLSEKPVALKKLSDSALEQLAITYNEISKIDDLLIKEKACRQQIADLLSKPREEWLALVVMDTALAEDVFTYHKELILSLSDKKLNEFYERASVSPKLKEMLAPEITKRHQQLQDAKQGNPDSMKLLKIKARAYFQNEESPDTKIYLEIALALCSGYAYSDDFTEAEYWLDQAKSKGLKQEEIPPVAKIIDEYRRIPKRFPCAIRLIKSEIVDTFKREKKEPDNKKLRRYCGRVSTLIELNDAIESKKREIYNVIEKLSKHAQAVTKKGNEYKLNNDPVSAKIYFERAAGVNQIALDLKKTANIHFDKDYSDVDNNQWSNSDLYHDLSSTIDRHLSVKDSPLKKHDGTKQFVLDILKAFACILIVPIPFVISKSGQAFFTAKSKTERYLEEEVKSGFKESLFPRMGYMRVSE